MNSINHTGPTSCVTHQLPALNQTESSISAETPVIIESLIPQQQILPIHPFYNNQRIQQFLEDIEITVKEWASFSLEDVLIFKIFTILDKQEKPSLKQLEAFFELMSLIQSKEQIKGHQFNLLKILSPLNDNKNNKLVTTLGILTDLKSLLPFSIGEIYGENKCIVSEEKAWLSAKNYACPVKFLSHYSSQITSELTQLIENRKNQWSKMKKMAINEQFKKKAPRIKKGYSIKPDSNDKRLKFLGEDKFQHLYEAADLFKLRCKLVDSMFKASFASFVDNKLYDSQNKVNLFSFIPQAKICLNFLDKQTMLLIDLIEELHEITKEANTCLKKAQININITGEDGQDRIFKFDNPDHFSHFIEKGGNFLEATQLAIDQTRPSSRNLSERDLAVTQSEAWSDQYKEMKEQIFLWQKNHHHFLSALIEKFKTVETFQASLEPIDNQEANTWLFLAEEIENESRKYKTRKTKPKIAAPVIAFKQSSKSSLEEFEIKINPSSKPSTQSLRSKESLIDNPLSSFEGQIPKNDTKIKTFSLFSSLPKLNDLINKELRCLLQQKIEDLDLSEESLIKVEKSSKELRDHMHYAALNFLLFAQAILQGDFYSIGAILPMLFMDLHIQTEQLMKHALIRDTGDYPNTHSLLTLSKCYPSKLSLEQQEFVKNFNYAMIQARYPIASHDHYEKPPQALSWILFSLELANLAGNQKGMVNEEAINKLSLFIPFVFDSFKAAQSLVLDQFHPSSEISQTAKMFWDNLESCKKELQDSLSTSKQFTLNDWGVQKGKKNMALVILNQRKILLQTIGKMPRNVGNEPTPLQPLQEAAELLLRIDIANHMRKHYSDLKFSPIHQRNLLTFQWVFEQLYVCQGMAKGLGDLRWIRNHDLQSYHTWLYTTSDRYNELKAFNFKRMVHYHRDKDKEQALPMMLDLFQALKYSKQEAVKKEIKVEFKSKRKEHFPNPCRIIEENLNLTLKQGIQLLEVLVKETINLI
ncbi:MAG: hypothetical protein H0T62_09665 [Parachlamydiaceae bacterium]|nr:hypothetical protein [Parachlamydiaceae bacterium]